MIVNNNYDESLNNFIHNNNDVMYINATPNEKYLNTVLMKFLLFIKRYNYKPLTKKQIKLLKNTFDFYDYLDNNNLYDDYKTDKYNVR
jgi:hypothetical protein